MASRGILNETLLAVEPEQTSRVDAVVEDEIARLTVKCAEMEKDVAKWDTMNTREWYKIDPIRFVDYVKCLEPIYYVLESRNAPKSDPDVFLDAIMTAYYGQTAEAHRAAAAQRLFENALSMKMGDFHEELMGKFPGYETLPTGHETGVDVRKKTDDVFIEVKNRDNTMNSGSAETVVRDLTRLSDAGKTAILVMVNSAKKTLPRFKAPKEIMVFNGRQMYAYLSGDETFYDKLLETMSFTFRNYPTYEMLERELAAPRLPRPV
jgi:hypothetical protein